MADSTIGGLTAATAAADTDLLEISQGGTSKKLAAALLRQYVNASQSFSTASQAPTAATDTYLTGSGVLIPAGGLVAGMVYRWHIGVTKTAAGTAAPVWTFRIGSARTTADTSRLAITGTAQVATASGTLIEIIAQILVVSGTVGTFSGAVNTGAASFGIGGNGVSAGFANNALGGNYIGLSVNTGTSGAWTVNSVMGELT